MVQRIRAIFTFIFTLCIISAFSVSVVSSQNNYGFAYLTASQSGDNAQLVIVDSFDRTSSAKTIQYPIPSGWLFLSPRPQNVVVSPNGNWIASALFAADQSRLMVHLINVVSGEERQIIEGYITVRGQSIAWSPDGRYLALNIGHSPNDLDLYVYALADGKLTNLSDDAFDQQDIRWSADSTWITSFTRPCTADVSCASNLDVFDVSTGSLVSSVGLLDLPLLGSSACNAIPSPDKRYISFVSNCGFEVADVGDFPREMVMWDLQTGDMAQITDFSASANGQLFRATYRHEWYNTETLLVGVNYQIGDSAQNQEFFTYQPNSRTTTILSTTIGTGFKLNPVNKQLVLTPFLAFGSESSATTLMQLEVVTLAQDTLTSDVSVNVPSGCQSGWSPDGTRLYYVLYSEGNCQGIASAVVFIDPATGNMQTIDFLTSNTPDNYVIPIGWVAR